MRKFHLLLLSLMTTVALGGSVLFTSCLNQGGSNGDPVNPIEPVNPVDPVDPVDPIEPVDPVDPVTKKTEVTYILTDGERETVLGTVKQEEGSLLSYGEIVTWYTDKSLQTIADKAVGDSMTVYGLMADEAVFLEFRSDGFSVDFIEASVSDGSVILGGAHKEGHTLLYWQVGEKTYRAGEAFALTEDLADSVVVFTAVWQVNQYKISYVSDGQTIETKTQEYGSEPIAAPEKTGYIFLGWYNGDEKTTVIEEEGTLTARWQIRTYRVRFELNGGSGSYTDGAYDYGKTLTLGASEKLGYSFEGWQVSVDGGEYTAAGENYTVGTALEAEELTFRAVFTAKERTVTVVGEKGESSATIATGDNLLNALKGYQTGSFSGWFYDEALQKPVGANDVLPAYADSESFTLYGSFNRSITVTLMKDGSVYQSVTGNYGEEIEATAEKYGYVFTGWYDEKNELVESIPAADTTLYAGWKKDVFTLTFDTKDEGVRQIEIKEEYLTVVVLPELKASEGHYDIFVGWSVGEETYSAGTNWTVEKNVTLTAVWKPKMISLKLTDWDGTVLVEDEVEAGSLLTLSGDCVLGQADEFEGFRYQTLIGDYVYYKEGDLLTESVEATAYYVNRRTGEQLVFPDVSNFVFKERADGTYYVSGRDGVFTDNKVVNSSDAKEALLDAQFYGEKLASDLCLPVTYNGKLVTAIPNASAERFGAFSIAYYDHYGFNSKPYTISEKLYIPSAYNFIGSYAFGSQKAEIVEFGRNSQLTYFNYQTNISMNAKELYGFPSGIKAIYNAGLSGMKGTIYDDDGNEITALPASVTYLGTKALSNSTFLKTADLSNVTYCGESVFYGCTKLESVVWSQLNIGSRMFYYCDNLKSFFVPAGVKKIGSQAFSYCGLEEITFAENSKLTTIGFAAFVNAPIKSIELPDSVETLEDSVFTGKNYTSLLTNVKLSASLKTIGENCFAYTPIKRVEFPEGLQSIGTNAFYYCNDLRWINIPESLETIGEYAFQKNSLVYTADGSDDISLSFGSKLQLIDQYAFAGFANVSSIEFALDGELTEIDAYAFMGMSRLSGTIRFPNKLKKIGSRLFSVAQTGSNTLAGEGAAQIEEVYIPASVEYIYGYAFAYMSKLTKVTFEDNNAEIVTDEDGVVTPRLSLGNAAFGWCTALTEIELPCQVTQMTGGVMNLMNGVFIQCTSLTSVTFRGRTDGQDLALQMSSVTFSGCTALKTIRIDRDTEVEITFNPRYFGEAVTNTLLLEDSTSVRLYVRESCYQYYNEGNNAWATEVAAKHILRVFKI